MRAAIHAGPRTATTVIPVIQKIMVAASAKPPGPDEFELDCVVTAVLRIPGGARANSSDRQLLGADALWTLHVPDGNCIYPNYGNSCYLIILTYRRVPDLYNTIGNRPSNSFLD